MVYLISYDISDPKRLYKVAKILENYGLRIQYSFFECEMEKEKMIEVRDMLLKEMKLKEDSLRIYPLCNDCLKKTLSIGNGNVYLPANYQIL